MAEKRDPSLLIAMTGFKGSLSNIEACKAVSEAATQLGFHHQILPMGDGGKGTSLPVHLVLGGEYVPIESVGPLGDKAICSVLCLPNAISPHSLFIESSDTCGWALVSEEKRDAQSASSRGLGILLNACHSRWAKSVKHIFVALGDSAISDVGIGMLGELGFEFLNPQQKKLDAITQNLGKISQIRLPKTLFENCQFTVLCDVQNPLCGPTGSARVFSPQKGASFQEVLEIERGMENFAAAIETAIGKQIRLEPMSGSAGGLAAALNVFLNAKLVPGCEFILQWLNFDALINNHSIVITGEGRTDKQTLSRKAPAVISEHTAKAGKNLLLISGSLGEGHEQLKNLPHVLGCFESGRTPNPYQALVEKTKSALLALLG